MEVIKNKRKENKAITVVSLVITVAIMIIITFVMSININTRYQSQNLDKLSSDLRLLKDKVLLYYTENGKYPIEGDQLNEDEDEYKLDLSKLSGLTLNFGSEKDEDDIYIINTSNGVISYKKGIKYKNETYYHLLDDDNEVAAISVLKVTSMIVEIQDESGNVIETEQVTESNRVFNIESETKVVFKVKTNISEGVSYQWYKNEEEISGATEDNYEVSEIESEDVYYCQINYEGANKSTEKVRLFLED